MKKALRKLVEGEHIELPTACTAALEKKFKKAQNIEWQQVNTNFEAIFYQENLEFIALFKANGKLIEYRKNLPEGYLPIAIKKLVPEKGEVMDRVLVNRGNELFYELIYRDKALNRFILMISDVGQIISHSAL
ncbi:MAG: hypothetical protein ACI9L9_000327 [Marivirga sp.]|jgi:hypothetical protein